MRQYPQLEIDLSLLQSNARAVISRCNAAGICVCGVIKGADGLPEIARTLHAAGAAELGTSRLEQVAKCRAAGVPGPWLLIRIPGLSGTNSRARSVCSTPPGPCLSSSLKKSAIIFKSKSKICLFSCSMVVCS